MTKFDYEVETSKLLNSVSPEARKIITSQPEYSLSVADNDYLAAYQFVYDWLHGKAMSIADAQTIRKRVLEAREEMKRWKK